MDHGFISSDSVISWRLGISVMPNTGRGTKMKSVRSRNSVIDEPDRSSRHRSERLGRP